MVEYADMRAILTSGQHAASPDVMEWDEGKFLLYSGKVNFIFGDPESGKTWVALAAVASALRAGRRAAFIDIDHNGAWAIGTNLQKLGVPFDTVCNRDEFRWCSPDTPEAFTEHVGDLARWEPNIVVIDSVGELLPIFGASSNDADEFTDVNRRVSVPLAKSGAAVVLIDHLAKNDASRAQGPTGTGAKKRVTDGLMLRVAAVEPFTPGRGGKAVVKIHKDRPGGVRAYVPNDRSREQTLGNFCLTDHPDGSLTWAIVDHAARPAVADDDKQRLHRERLDTLCRLGADLFTITIKEVQNLLLCGQTTATNLRAEAREMLTELDEEAA